MREGIVDRMRRARRTWWSVFGRDIGVTPDHAATMELVGSEVGEGGWVVHTDMLCADSIVYSLGVGTDISFDLDLIERFGVAIHAFDPTPECLRWLAEQQLPSGFHVHTYGVAGIDGHIQMAPPERPGWVSRSAVRATTGVDDSVTVEVKRLRTIMSELGHSRIDLLKMDIEGSEYGVIDDMIKSNLKVRQLLVEFHHRFPEVARQKTLLAIEQLRSAGYTIFYVTPRGEEVSFLSTGQ